VNRIVRSLEEDEAKEKKRKKIASEAGSNTVCTHYGSAM